MEECWKMFWIVWGPEIQTRTLTASYNHCRLTIHFSVHLKIALNHRCLHDHQTAFRLHSRTLIRVNLDEEVLTCSVNRLYLSK